MTRVRHKGVRPGWTLMEGEDIVVVSSDQRRAVMLLNEVKGPGESPAFSCFMRFSTYYTSDELEFNLIGYVTGYEYGEEWLEGGDPGTMLGGSVVALKANPFEELDDDQRALLQNQ